MAEVVFRIVWRGANGKRLGASGPRYLNVGELDEYLEALLVDCRVVEIFIGTVRMPPPRDDKRFTVPSPRPLVPLRRS